MNEITLLTEIQPPPPAQAAEIRQAARARLDAAMAGRRPPRRRAAARYRPGRPVLAAAAAVAAVCTALIVQIVLPAGQSATPFVTAAWAVQRNADGTVSIRIRGRAIAHPGRLEEALAADGIQAEVRYGVLCTPTGPVLPQQQAVVKGPFHVGPYYVTRLPLYDPFEWKIRPAAMPAGSRLVISELHPVRTATEAGAPLAIELVGDNQPVTCSAKLPDWARLRG